MSQVFPLDVEVPTAAILTQAVRLPFYEEAEIVQVSGHLRGITLGTFTVEVRDQDGNLVATLSWTAAGVQKVLLEAPLPVIPHDGYVQYNVTSIGIGAVGCQMTLWGRIS